MQAGHFAERNREEPKRILLSEISLVGERQMRKIRERLDWPIRKPSLVKRNPGAHPRQHGTQPFELERAPPRVRQRLDFLIPDHSAVPNS